MTTAQFHHAETVADQAAAYLARHTKPRQPHGTQRLACNDGYYGHTRAISVTHRQPDGRCRTINVIASTRVSAEIAALDQMSFPGH